MVINHPCKAEENQATFHFPSRKSFPNPPPPGSRNCSNLDLDCEHDPAFKCWKIRLVTSHYPLRSSASIPEQHRHDLLTPEHGFGSSLLVHAGFTIALHEWKEFSVLEDPFVRFCNFNSAHLTSVDSVDHFELPEPFSTNDGPPTHAQPTALLQTEHGVVCSDLPTWRDPGEE